MMRMRNINPLVIAFLLAVSLLAHLGYWPELADDAYITLRYSENVAAGRGWVYNDGERISGSTSPLWTLLIAGAARSGMSPVTAAKILGVLFIFLTACITYSLLSPGLGSLPALTAAVVSIVSTVNVSSAGLEFPLLLFLGALSIRLHTNRRYLSAAVTLGLMLITRGDGILLGAILFVDLAVRERRIPWKEALVAAAVAAPWFAFSTFYFGSPLPQTLHAKTAQFESGFWYNSFVQKLWKVFLGDIGHNPLLFFLYPLAVVGIFKRNRASFLIFLWAALYAVSYVFLRVPGYIWYCVIPYFGLGIMAAAGVSLIEEKGRGRTAAALILSLILLVSIVLYPLAPLLRSAGRRYVDYKLRVSPQSHPSSFYYEKLDGMLAHARESAGLENPSLAAAALVLALALLLSARKERRSRTLWTAVLCGILIFPRICSFSLRIRGLPSRRNRVYRAIGEWIERHTPPASSLAADEIGMIGYYSRRKIVDMGGIVTPSVARDLARGDRTSWLYRYQPDFVLLQGLWIFEEPVEELSYFNEGYAQIRAWPRGAGLTARLYKKKKPSCPAEQAVPLVTVRRWIFGRPDDAKMWRIADPTEMWKSGISPRGAPLFTTSGDDSSLECREVLIEPSSVSQMIIRLRAKPCPRCRKASIAYLRWRVEGDKDYPPFRRASFSTKGNDEFMTYVIDLSENHAWRNSPPVISLKITPTTVASELEFDSIELRGPASR